MKIKEQASKALAEMGGSVSDAVRLLLVRVAAGKAVPFEVGVPNAVTPRTIVPRIRATGNG